MSKRIDLTGKIFGLVRCDSPAPSQKGKTYWNCSCIQCGKTKIIQTGHLTSGTTRTCGCGCKYEDEEVIKTHVGDKKICEICGKEFQISDGGWTRRYCYKCSPTVKDGYTQADNITAKRRALKKMLIEYKGGKCQRCGYDKCMRSLQFHHLDPSQKDFGISHHLNRKVSDLKKEVDKCILLCSNCHAEVHQELFEQGLIKEDE